ACDRRQYHYESDDLGECVCRPAYDKIVRSVSGLDSARQHHVESLRLDPGRVSDWQHQLCGGVDLAPHEYLLYSRKHDCDGKLLVEWFASRHIQRNLVGHICGCDVEQLHAYGCWNQGSL